MGAFSPHVGGVFQMATTPPRRGGANGSSSSPSSRRNVFVLAALVAQAVLLCAFVVAQKSSSSSFSPTQYLLFASSTASTSESGPTPPQRALGEGSGGVYNDQDVKKAVAAALSDLIRGNPLLIPPGQPPNLPRLEIAAVAGASSTGDDGTNEAELLADAKRSFYGGRGDGKHLGGFTDFDPAGVAPSTWAHMIRDLGVKSVVDVGCGRGISTRWFLEHNLTVLCVEGSKDAVRQSFVPPPLIVEHDYSRGPWWPADTYDAAWSVEFLEHVSRPYMHNYVQTLRKAALVFVTSSRWGGWHHVEIHNDEWWIRKFASYGFVYDDKLTTAVRKWAKQEWRSNYTLPTGKVPGPQHVSMSMKVFINPAVAALPKHAHLFFEHGCLGDPRPNHTWKDGGLPFLGRECGTGRSGSKETALAESFLPLPVDMHMHERWVEAIRAGIALPEEGDAAKKTKTVEANPTDEPPPPTGADEATKDA